MHGMGCCKSSYGSPQETNLTGTKPPLLFFNLMHLIISVVICSTKSRSKYICTNWEVLTLVVVVVVVIIISGGSGGGMGGQWQ